MINSIELYYVYAMLCSNTVQTYSANIQCNTVQQYFSAILCHNIVHENCIAIPYIAIPYIAIPYIAILYINVLKYLTVILFYITDQQYCTTTPLQCSSAILHTIYFCNITSQYCPQYCTTILCNSSVLQYSTVMPYYYIVPKTFFFSNIYI